MEPTNFFRVRTCCHLSPLNRKARKFQSSFAAEAEELSPCCATEILYKPQMLAVLVYLIAQSCPTLCGPMDCSLPGFSVCGIFQARILEWLPLGTPGDLSDPGIKPKPFASLALAGRFFTTCPTWEAPFYTGSHFSLGNLHVKGPVAHVTSCCHIEQCRFQTSGWGKQNIWVRKWVETVSSFISWGSPSSGKNIQYILTSLGWDWPDL